MGLIIPAIKKLTLALMKICADEAIPEADDWKMMVAGNNGLFSVTK